MSSIFFNNTLVQSTDGLNPLAASKLFDGAAANVVSANVYSVPFWCGNKDTLCLQVSCAATGSPNGSFAMQGSNDYSQLESQGKVDATVLNWSTLSFWDEALGSQVQSKAVVGAQSYMATIQVYGPGWWRMLWTNTSGTALLIAKIRIKADGGR